MYGWTDPFDPAASRHPGQPAGDDPAWLTDRPAPRSSYLFGDEPDRPADEWHRDEPTARWQPDERPAGQWRADESHATDRWQPDERPADQWRADGNQASDQWRADESHATDQWQPGRWQADEERWQADDRAAGQWSDGGWYPAERHPDPYQGGDGRFEQAAGAWPAEDPTAPVDLSAHRAPAATTPARHDGTDRGGAIAARRAETGRRPGRRFSRPVVLGGAAAAATLVVSLGVAALALPGGGGGSADPTAGDAPIAAVQDPTDQQDSPLAAPATPTPTPSGSPSAASPSPSPSKTARPAPSPSRTSAPSRQSSGRSTAPSVTPTRTGVAGAGGSQAAEVVNLVNAERAKVGCDPLSIDDKLTTAAQRHSQDQADHRNMSHTGSDGSNPGTRIDRVGYEWRAYGENVAWNQKTPAAVMDAWMNSDGHRANILNCTFTEIGVGVASSNGPYWTQVFGTPR